MLGDIRPHDTRRVFTEACGSLGMGEYYIKYLRGDVVGQDAMHGYMGRFDIERAREKVQEVSDYLNSFRVV